MGSRRNRIIGTRKVISGNLTYVTETRMNKVRASLTGTPHLRCGTGTP